ncbi:MAG: AAA family ATPase [Ignavibacteriaceae bacterium]
MKVSQISIRNFKSIRKLDLTLNKINVLIGQNGAGKSNFIQFFNLLNNIVSQNLQNYVTTNGGADNLLYFGRKHSESFSGTLFFGWNHYNFELTATNENKLFFSKEITGYQNTYHGGLSERNLANGNSETNLIENFRKEDHKGVVHHILGSMVNWRVYHFHDTSSTSKVKQEGDINDNRTLRRDASNLAAYLYLLQEKFNDYYLRIENTIKLIAPFFEKFQLQPLALNKEKIRLEWKHIGSDEYFNANHLSDGTLRMICLITLLLQPNLPDTIIIDEPELGLHPAAIELLTSLIKSVTANDKQVICSTQSVTFLNHFEPEDIIVVDRNDGESIFKHLDKNSLTEWLNEYAIGELWEKNVLGGRP